MLIPSLINLFLAPASGRMVRSLAKSHGAVDFYCEGIAVYCPEERICLMKDALGEVVRFFGADWPLYRKNIKCIVLDAEASTTLWFSARTLVINLGDSARTGSVAHMAGWLTCDFERIQFLRKNRSLHLIRSERVMKGAVASGRAKRDEYMRRPIASKTAGRP